MGYTTLLRVRELLNIACVTADAETAVPVLAALGVIEDRLIDLGWTNSPEDAADQAEARLWAKLQVGHTKERIA